MSEYYQAKREGKIKFGYDFANASQVLGLWNLKLHQTGHSASFKIPGRENEIVCLLREDDGSGWKYIPHPGLKCDGRGWNEILRIDESNADGDKAKKRVSNELDHPQLRYVFLHQTRLGTSWYKFYGVFKLDEQATRKEDEYICIYSRVSEEGTCFKEGEEVQNAGEMLEPEVFDIKSPTPLEKTLKKLDRGMDRMAKIFEKKGSAAHKRVVKAILLGAEFSAWAFSMSGKDPGEIGLEDIPEGFLKAYVIGGGVGYVGMGNYALYDEDGQLVEMLDRSPRSART